MREILFRGKREDNGEWVYGDLLQNIDAIKIRENEKETKRISKSYEIDTKTIGQYTGFTDKKGKKIFEGDICHFYGGDFYGGDWRTNYICAIEINHECLHYLENAEKVEVIGNIYDNPELLNKPVGNSDQLEVKND